MSATDRNDPRAFLQWQKYQSAHFTFWFMPGSQAEKNVMGFAADLEAVRDATAKALELADLPEGRVQVYLSDMPGGQQGESQVYEMGGQQVIAVYLSDAPGEVLERALVEVLLTSSLGVDADKSAMLVDGVQGYVAQLTGDSGSAELNAALLGLQSEGRRITLSDAIRGPAAETRRLYQQVVTSFVAFLLTSRGTEPFKRFTREFDPAQPDRASEAAYGKQVSALEVEWLANLEQTQSSVLGSLEQEQSSAPGVMGFLRRSFPYLRPYWARLVLILLTTAVGAVFLSTLPLAFGQIVNQLDPQMGGTQNYNFVGILLAAVVVLFLLQSPATVLKEYLVAQVGARVMNDMRIKMFDHLQRLSTSYYTRTRPGDILSRFSSDLGIIEVGMTKMLPTLVSLAITFVFGLVALVYSSWLLALGLLVMLPILFIIPARLGARAAKVVPEQQRDRAMVSSTIQENIGAQQVVKAYSLQEMSLRQLRAQLDQLGQSVTRAGFASTLPGLSATLSVALVQVLALVGGVALIYFDRLSVGSLASFQLLIGVVTAPVTGLSQVLQLLLQASAGMQRVDELLNEKPQVEDAPDAKPLGRFQGEIRFDNVNFSYTGEQVNLRDFDLTIPAGEYVAFVGPSGSGKSTVLNLIMRFYDPTTGAVIIDGQDLRQVTQESLRSQIGAVFQETFLYNTTVRENVRLSKTDATDYEVEKAAKAAEIHDFILTLPRGYDTPVGERGGRLSGGQKQRIALARAILYDPAILVLDEPTSALDPETEAAINATLEKLAKGRTVLMVTHRLASVADADRVVVLERGRIVEEGSHEELLRARGLYYRLWGQQNGFETVPDEPQADGGGTDTVASRLRSIPFFEGLDDALLATLAGRFVAERYGEGATVFEEGDPGDKLYFVDRGEVDVVITLPSGEEKRSAVLRDGDYFGEMALLQETPRTATIRVRAPSTLLALTRDQFLDLLNTVPELRESFERGMEARRQANFAVLRDAVRAGR